MTLCFRRTARTIVVGSGCLNVHGKEMMYEWDIEDGGEMEGTSKTSQYQVIPADRLASYQHARLALRWERRKMNNPVYYRLLKDGNFVGFKRNVTEYLPSGQTRWQLDPFPHDSEATQKLSKPAMGIATLGREKIVTTQQRRVSTGPRKGDEYVILDGDFPPMPKVKPPKKDNG